MKKTSIFLWLVLILTVSGCKEDFVRFEETQPQDIRAMNEFPKNIQGNYESLDSITLLFITHNQIIKKLIIDDTLKMSDISENERIVGDSLIHLRTNYRYRIQRINDSLFSNYVLFDTIFIINKDHVLKKFKGHFFLNRCIKNSDCWAVEKLSYSNEILNINRIETEEELNLLQTITETKMDSTKAFSVKPTKKQFKEFLKKNGFANGDTYLKKEIK